MGNPVELVRINGDSVLLPSGALIKVWRPWCTLLQYIKGGRSLWLGIDATKAFGLFTTYLIEIPIEIRWREDKVALTAHEWQVAMEEIASTAEYFGAFIVFDAAPCPSDKDNSEEG